MPTKYILRLVIFRSFFFGKTSFLCINIIIRQQIGLRQHCACSMCQGMSNCAPSHSCSVMSQALSYIHKHTPEHRAHMKYNVWAYVFNFWTIVMKMTKTLKWTNEVMTMKKSFDVFLSPQLCRSLNMWINSS